jgi:hypothetical protein
MATYSNIGIKLITTGDESGTWGDTTNTNFSGVLDEAIAGVVTYNISSDADVTLTVSDGSSSDARHAVINFTSTTLSATRTVTFAPDTLQKTWLVINSTTGGQSLTFKQGSVGATITVANGESAWIYSDGAGATNGAITKALDSFTNTKITTGTLNATTLDLTNLEVTNVKAKDGTAAFSIADSTGKVTVSSELAVDNLNLSGNAITSTNTDGNIDLTPNGTGEVNITKVDIDAGTIDGTTIGGASAAAGTFTTLTATTLGGALDANNQAITNINVDSGAIDGTPIGANSASTGAFTTATATTGNITTVNATTVDTTNVEVTAIKAKDGTAAATIADSTGVVTIGSSVLTTADINGGTIDGTTIGGASAAAGTFTSLNSSSASTFNGGVVINELGADADTRIEGDTDANLFFVDASTDRIGIGTSSPSTKLHVVGGATTEIRVVTSGDLTTTGASFLRFGGSNSGTSGYLGYGGTGNTYDIYNGLNGPLEFYTNASKKMVLDASGNLGLGVTPSAWDSGYKALQIGQAASFWSATGSNFTTITNNAIFDGAYKYKNDGIATQYSMGTGGNHAWNIAASGTAGDPITFTQAMGLDASGNLGLGTTAAAGVRFDVRNDSTTTLADMRNANASGFGIYIAAGSSSSQYVQRWADYNNNALATLDASGNLCVGSTSPGNAGVINVSVGNPGTTIGGLQLWSTTSGTHYVQFGDSASGGDPYRGAVGYAHASDAMVFFTAGNERARITAAGDLLVGKTAVSNTTKGATISPSGEVQVTITNAGGSSQCIFLNREDADGDLIIFRQANATEGSISVSGSTVSYNGGHLSRWSQFPDGSHPDLVKGTVMTNLDQMAVWINPETGDPEENEQLNCMKVSGR